MQKKPTTQKQRIAQYRRLLTCEESTANLREALELLEAVADAAGYAVPGNGETPRQALVDRVASALLRIPRWVSGTKLTEETYSFLMDLCQLVFHQAYFTLLAPSESKGTIQQRENLLTAFHCLAEFIPRAADRFLVFAMVHEAEGRHELAGQAYRECVAATHSDDHEFMSVLQSAWVFHVEQREYRQALDLLLQASPRVARADLDEVHGLILLTFDRQQHDSGEPPARRRRTGTR